MIVEQALHSFHINLALQRLGILVSCSRRCARLFSGSGFSFFLPSLSGFLILLFCQQVSACTFSFTSNILEWQIFCLSLSKKYRLNCLHVLLEQNTSNQKSILTILFWPSYYLLAAGSTATSPAEMPTRLQDNFVFTRFI